MECDMIFFLYFYDGIFFATKPVLRRLLALFALSFVASALLLRCFVLSLGWVISVLF